MRAEQFFFGNPFESEFDLPPGFMGGVAVPGQEEQEQEQTLDIDAYLDALREGTGDYTSTLQTDLVEQGYLPDITVIGEGGAYGTEFDPESAMASVPIGSLENYDFGSFTFDKNLEDFGGTFGYGSLTNEQLQSFQNELLPIMAKEVAKQQTEGRQDYQSALMKAYQFNPEVQAIYEKYGVSPIRTSDEYGSVKLYDPFSFNEITLTDNRPGFDDYANAAIKAFIAYTAGQALPGLFETVLPQGVSVTASPTLTGLATAGAASGTTDPTFDLSEATGGFAGPLNTFAATPGDSTETVTEETTDDYTDPVLAAIDVAESLQEGGLFTTVNPLAGAQIPTVTTEEVTGGGTSAEAAEAQAPTFTQEQVDAQIAEEVAGATEGLLTQEQADAATQAAIDALPEDTTEFNQADIDSAVSSAVQEVESAFAEERTGFESTIEGLEQELSGEQLTTLELEDTISGLRDTLEVLESQKQEAIEAGNQRYADAVEEYQELLKNELDTAEQEYSKEKERLESQLEEEQQEVADLTNLVSNLETTAADLRTTLESTQTALQEQQEITQAKESDIEGLTTSVNTLTDTVSSLETKITEVTAAKDKAIADGDQKLADAMANAEATLEATKAEAEETLQNAIAAGETKAADAVAAGQAAVADAVAAGEAAAEAAEAAGREEGFGEGRGTGRGEGVGAGTGLGLALGLGAGMLQPQSVTKTMFEDFEFEKKYEAPEILAGLTGLPVYQAPKIGLFQGLI